MDMTIPIAFGVPFGIVAALSTVNPTAALCFRKILCYAWAWLHVFISNEGSVDKRIKSLPDPDLLLNQPTQKVTIIFIRHGESAWNEIFNKGPIAERLVWLVPRLVMAGIREGLSLLTPRSIFLDSPLSREGVAQAQTLRALVEGRSEDPLSKKSDDPSVARYLELLAGKQGKTVLVSSNLSRAVETMVIGFMSRLKSPDTKIFIRSELQEVSPNIDTMALALTSGNKGQKTMRGNPANRFTTFASWCFEASHPAGATFVVGGHSKFFTSFFKAFLGRSVEHVAKKKKIVNTGEVFRVDPDSITVVSGGFK